MTDLEPKVLGPIVPVSGHGTREMVNGFLRAHHYLRRGVPGWRVALTLRDSENELLLRGVVVVGTPSSRELMKRGFVEVTRLCAHAAPKNAASYLLGAAKRWAEPRGFSLVSYSDPGVGHSGTVYRTAGFTHAGKSKGGTWGNRPGHKQGREGPKDRWVWLNPGWKPKEEAPV